MYNVLIHTIANNDRQLLANDIDHAIALADAYRQERFVNYVAIRKRNAIVSVVYDARDVYELM